MAEATGTQAPFRMPVMGPKRSGDSREQAIPDTGQIAGNATSAGHVSTREISLVLLVSLALTLIAFACTPRLVPADPGFAYPSDHHKYLRMAEAGLFRFRIAPFHWRVLVPFLCGLLPCSKTVAFSLLTFLSIWLTGAAVYLLVRGDPAALGSQSRFQPADGRGTGRGRIDVLSLGPAGPGLLALLLYFTLGWAVRFLLYDFWLPDGAAILLIVLALHAAMTGRALRLALLLALGVTVKESVILAAPVYYSWNASRPFEPRLLGRTGAILLPAAGILAALHLALPGLNNDPSYTAGLGDALTRLHAGVYQYAPLGAIPEILRARLHELSPARALAYLIRPFGVAPIAFALLGLKDRWRAALRLLPFVLLVYLQILFAWNTDRLLVLAFPALLLLAPAGWSRLRRWGIAPEFVGLVLGGFFALNFLGHGQYPARFGLQAALLAVGVLAGVMTRWQARRGSGRGSRSARPS